MIVTVTPNPAVDITLEVATLHPGQSHVIPTARRRAGGKGLNVARVLAQTSHAATATGPVADADRAWFTADLPGVDMRLTGCAAPTRCTYALVEGDRGRTSQLNECGQSRSADEWDAVITTTAAACAQAACLTVSGSLPPDTPESVIVRLLAAAREAGIPAIADLIGEPLHTAAATGADILKPNRAELAATCGTDDPIAGARMLQHEGAGLVVVSLGEAGMIAVPADAAPLRARLPRPLVGNATGAGDAAVAAMAAALDSGWSIQADLDEILRQAVAWSAAAVLAPLAGSLHPSYPDLATDVRFIR